MRVSASISRDLGMPAIYLHILAELLNTIGLDERDLLLRVGLDPIRLKSTEVRVSQAQAGEFVTRAQCEDALKQLTGDAGFDCRVRRVIETSYPFPPKLARAAATLFVSDRTLKRRLQEKNASFQNLVDQVRLERARELLTGTSMNLNQIADVLGYADAANFTRAFKRWTGVSPSHYRTTELQSAGVCQHTCAPATA